jgi:hypothetical protein
MDKTTATLGFGLVLLVALGGHAVYLQSRVSSLEAEIGSLQTDGSGVGPAASPRDARSPEADRVAIAKTVKALREATERGEALTEQETEALVQSVVEDAVDEAFGRKAEQRELKQTDRQMQMMEDSVRVEVEDLGKDFDLSDDDVTRSVEVLVGAMYEGQAIREQLRDESMTMREAKTQGDALKTEIETDLREILGDEAYEELGRRFYGEQGWDARG